MRKTVINPDAATASTGSEENWLDLEQIASVELTSEDPNFPIEFALTAGGGGSWRAGKPGKQVIRIVFDNPLRLRRIWLEFSERDVQRTQEFSLSWSRERDEPLKEIVCQQWSFSPQGSTTEVEDYRVDLEGVSVLELTLKPDLAPTGAFATLAAWRVV
jgi:hypothetical protein